MPEASGSDRRVKTRHQNAGGQVTRYDVPHLVNVGAWPTREAHVFALAFVVALFLLVTKLKSARLPVISSSRGYL